MGVKRFGEGEKRPTIVLAALPTKDALSENSPPPLGRLKGEPWRRCSAAEARVAWVVVLTDGRDGRPDVASNLLWPPPRMGGWDDANPQSLAKGLKKGATVPRAPWGATETLVVALPETAGNPLKAWG